MEVILKEKVLGQQFNVYGDYENPLFLAKDVATWIDYDVSSLHKMLKNVDEDEKVRNIVPTLGGNQEAWFLTEQGLYEVLMQSRKPIAKQFKKQVKVILKDIRKHGAYLTNEKIEEVLLSPDTLINLATQLKEERAKVEQLENELRESTRYLDLILDSKDDILTTQIAQDYGMSAKKFNLLLNELGIQRLVNRQWILYAKYQGKGYINSRTHSFVDKKGNTRTNITTVWTQSGREFLYRRLRDNDILPLIEIEGN